MNFNILCSRNFKIRYLLFLGIFVFRLDVCVEVSICIEAHSTKFALVINILVNLTHMGKESSLNPVVDVTDFTLICQTLMFSSLVLSEECFSEILGIT